MICDKCGVTWPDNQLVIFVRDEGRINLFCPKCAMFSGQCPMCEHYPQCGFKEDPDPMPQFVMVQQVQEVPGGHSIIQQQVPNTERLRKFCLDGKCVCCNEDDPKDPFCCRYTGFGTCRNYKEKHFESKNTQ